MATIYKNKIIGKSFEMKVGPLLSLEFGYSCLGIIITDTAAVALDSNNNKLKKRVTKTIK